MTQKFLIEIHYEKVSGHIVAVSIYEQIKEDSDKIMYLVFVDNKFESVHKKLPSKRTISRIAALSLNNN